MVWQIAGVESVYEGTTILKTGGSTLKILLLQAPFSFSRNTYTNLASIVGSELVNVDTGYTSGAGGFTIASRIILKKSTYVSIDPVDQSFTPLKLTPVNTAILVGAALIDSTNNIVLCTAAFDVPVTLDSLTAKAVSIPTNNEAGLFGIYHGGPVAA